MKLSFLLTVGAFATTGFSSSTISCGDGVQCPEDAPCCSQYGECGTGLYCLGACDVRHSFNVSACVPLPVCESKTYTFPNTDSIVDQSKYLGDASEYGWTTNGEILAYNGNVLLTMGNQSYGTVISSTKGIWYGNVKATFETSHGQGVVSAFILMSGSKDEIDYEFVGSELETAQTNFYWEGVLNYTNSANISVSDTETNFHTYEVDWTEDRIQWLVDGKVGRTLNKADTYNATTKEYQYPQTPSIIQLSIWPGGSSLNPQGTINWAGGPINWDMPEFKDPGYLYVNLKEIDVTCYSAPSDAIVSGNNSYVFTSDTDLLQSDVAITNDSYVLGSFEACGFDMDKGKDVSTAVLSQAAPTNIAQKVSQVLSEVSVSSSTTSVKSKATKSSGSASASSETSKSSGSSSSSGNSNSGSVATSSSSNANGGFNQGVTSGKSNSGTTVKVAGSSLLGFLLIAIAALL